MVYPKDFEDKVKEVTSGVAKMLVEKNKSYGNSALDPVRVFSKASTDSRDVRLGTLGDG